MHPRVFGYLANLCSAVAIGEWDNVDEAMNKACESALKTELPTISFLGVIVFGVVFGLYLLEDFDKIQQVLQLIHETARKDNINIQLMVQATH